MLWRPWQLHVHAESASDVDVDASPRPHVSVVATGAPRKPTRGARHHPIAAHGLRSWRIACRRPRLQYKVTNRTSSTSARRFRSLRGRAVRVACERRAGRQRARPAQARVPTTWSASERQHLLFFSFSFFSFTCFMRAGARYVSFYSLFFFF